MLPGRRTDNGAIFIAQGPAPAGTPLVAGIAVSPAGVIYASQALAPVWSPADLFLSGEQGAWYDPSDLTTMFQDSAGTTPVTADGQPVGLILDKSGRGNHAFQATDAARPLYKTDGTYRWLQFDGVDDKLETAAFTYAQPVDYFLGVKQTAAQVNQYLFDGIATDSAILYSTSATSPTNYIQYAGSGSGVAATLTNNVPSVLFSRFNGASSASRQNSVQTWAGTLSTPLINGLVLANSHTVTRSAAVGIYSFISLGRLATTQEITDTETWVNSKTGAY